MTNREKIEKITEELFGEKLDFSQLESNCVIPSIYCKTKCSKCKYNGWLDREYTGGIN